MSNKETLQSYNENLTNNNETLSSILNTINNLPEAGSGGGGGGEDLTEEIATYDSELDEQHVTLNDIIYALAGKGVPIDKNMIEPEYIKDGLVSWWEGCDPLDESNHWNSRVGEDYIYAAKLVTGTGALISNTIDTIKSENAYRNNMVYGLRTNGDYYIQDYTIEIVGKAFSVYNSSNSAENISSCTLISFNKSGSPLIGVGFENGLFFCLNVDASSSGKGMPTKIINCVGKRHKYVIHLNEISARNTTGYNQINYSVNNSGWFAMNRTNMPSYSDNTSLTNIMCYYHNNYYASAEINSIRIYNRKLTEEELLHNYEIDNARFELDDYETK